MGEPGMVSPRASRGTAGSTGIWSLRVTKCDRSEGALAAALELLEKLRRVPRIAGGVGALRAVGRVRRAADATARDAARVCIARANMAGNWQASDLKGSLVSEGESRKGQKLMSPHRKGVGGVLCGHRDGFVQRSFEDV